MNPESIGELPNLEVSTDEQELRTLLKENLALAKENNEMLKQMRRLGRIAFWAKAIIWTALIILPLLLIGPLMSYLSSIVGGVPGGSGSLLNTTLFGLPSPEMVNELLQN